jgi:hypothetical protein
MPALLDRIATRLTEELIQSLVKQVRHLTVRVAWHDMALDRIREERNDAPPRTRWPADDGGRAVGQDGHHPPHRHQHETSHRQPETKNPSTTGRTG